MTENNLVAMDVNGYAAPNLIFVIGNLLNGWFESIQTPNRSFTIFAQKHVQAGIIRFVHSGNQQAPFYTVVVTDGFKNSLPDTSMIHFSGAPVLQAHRFTVNKNQTIVLNQSNLNAIIPPSTLIQFYLNIAVSSDNASQILYEVPDAENGYFAVNSTPTNNFTQQQLNDNQTTSQIPQKKEIPTEEVLSAYYLRLSVEHIFCYSKSDLGLLPIRNHNNKTVQGYLFLQFLLLVIYLKIKEKVSEKYTVEQTL